MSGIIGKKVGMTTIFNAEGQAVPCTLIEAGPCVVTQVRTEEKDGYTAIQLGYGEKKEKNTSRPLVGHFKKAEDVFTEGDFLDVSGNSKGRGFQGVVKRHGFAGVGGQTHGQHNRGRHPGSIGACSFPSRVFKGVRMGGRMGNTRTTIQNLKVLKVMTEQNLIIVNGSIPGAKNSYITLHK